jgi:hypothetical protein
VRNSSLVELFCADNSSGLKHITEAADCCNLRIIVVVGERCVNRRSIMVMLCGGDTSEDAGMSNEKTDEKSVRRKIKDSWVKVIFPG